MTSDGPTDGRTPKWVRASRREIIQSFGAGFLLTGTGGLGNAAAFDGRSVTRAQQTTVSGEVTDLEGSRPVPETEVTFLEFRQYTLSYALSSDLEGPVRLLGNARTDDEGRFEIDLDPESIEGYVIIYARRVVGENNPDAETTSWFGTEIYRGGFSDLVEQDPSQFDITLNRRLIFTETRKRGAVSIWQEIVPDERYPHVIHVETRGNQYSTYDPSVVREEYRTLFGVDPPSGYDLFTQEPTLGSRKSKALFVSDLPKTTPGFSAFRTVVSELDVGFHTLQLPESVAVKYRDDHEELRDVVPLSIKVDDEKQADTATNLPPLSMWTDNEDAVASMYDNSFGFDSPRPQEFLDATGVGISIPEINDISTAPVFPLFAGQGSPTSGTGVSYRFGRDVETGQEKLFGVPEFLAYDRGRREIVESKVENLLIDLVTLGLTIAGFALTGPVATTLITMVGKEVENIDVSTAQNLPDFARAENQVALGTGQLPVDRREYDLVSGDWRFETYAHVQRFPLRFGDSGTESFCLRGMFRTDSDGEKELFSLQQAFEIDPTVLSPLDDGVVVPTNDTDDGQSPGGDRSQLPPSFAVTASDWNPEVLQSVTLAVEDVVTYGDADVESVEWSFEPPPNVEAFEDRALGDEGSRQRSGEEVTFTFGVQGDHEFTVSVTDTRGNTLSREFGIRVTEPTDEKQTFYDDFEDDTVSERPARWQILVDEGDFSATVKDQSSPAGQSKSLSISETTDGGTNGFIGWTDSQAVTGWDGVWTLSGLYYTAKVDTDRPFQTADLRCYRDPGGGSDDVRVTLGFTTGDNSVRPVQISGAPIDTIETKYTPDGGWQEGTWYNYELSHDGEGTYTARVWPESESRPSEPQARSTGSPPGTEARVAALQINGAESRPFDVRHDFMRLKRGVGPVVEDFEDGTLDEYTGDSKDQFSVRQDPDRALSRSKVLFGTNASQFDAHGIASLPGEGLNAYPSRGDAFSCYVYHEAGNVNSGVFFGAQDANFTENVGAGSTPDSTYQVGYDIEEDRYVIRREQNDTATVLATFSDPAGGAIKGKWLEYAVDWGDPEITFTVYEVDSNRNRTRKVGSVSVSDTTYSDGGVGFLVNDSGSAGTNVEILYDYFHITAEGEPTAEVIDDFEGDNPLSKYDYTAFGTDIRTDLTFDGSQALELPAKGRSTSDSQCVSTSGAIPYPSRGDTFGGYLYQPDSTNQFRYVFAAQSPTKDPDGYHVSISGSRGFVIEVDRQGTELARASLADVDHTGKWLEVEVDWKYESDTDTTTITATLYDRGQDGTEDNGQLIQIEGSESPSTYEQGGLGFTADGRGAAMAFDRAFKSPGSTDTSGPASGYLARYYNHTNDHRDFGIGAGRFIDDTNEGLVEDTLPLSLTSRGKGYIFDFDWFDREHFTGEKTLDSIDFDADSFPFSGSEENDPFFGAVHFRATATLPDGEGGTYEFSTTSDDDSWVFVDDQLVVDNGGTHSPTEATGSVTLDPGDHDLDVFYAERGGGKLRMLFEPPDVLEVGGGDGSSGEDPLTGPPAEYDADGDDDIDIGELGTAAADYTSGDLTVTELGRIASEYVNE